MIKPWRWARWAVTRVVSLPMVRDPRRFLAPVCDAIRHFLA